MYRLWTNHHGSEITVEREWIDSEEDHWMASPDVFASYRDADTDDTLRFIHIYHDREQGRHQHENVHCIDVWCIITTISRYHHHDAYRTATIVSNMAMVYI